MNHQRTHRKISGRLISAALKSVRKDEASTEKSLSFGEPSTWISALTLTLTIISITLYSAGRAVRYSYLTQFGVIDSIISWSPQDLIYLGAVNQLLIVTFTPFIVAGTCAAIMFFIAIMQMIDGIIQRFFRKRRFTRNPTAATNIKAQQVPDYRIELLARIGFFSFGIGIMVFFCIVFVSRSEIKGKELGSADKKSILENEIHPSKKVDLYHMRISRSVQGRTVTESGYALSCSEKACWLYRREKLYEKAVGVAVLVPLDFLLEVRSEKY